MKMKTNNPKPMGHGKNSAKEKVPCALEKKVTFNFGG